MMFAMLRIDENETRKNARKKLKTFRQLQRIAGRSSIDLKSPIITDMPRSKSASNRVDNSLIEKIDAELERDYIIDALARLSHISRCILFYSFCDVEKWSNYKIGLELGYSDKNIERLKRIVLIEFAEAYRGGKLLVPFEK